jgi:hypothetical protein
VCRLVQGNGEGVDAHEVNRVRATLALFVADVFASVQRKDQRVKSDCYLRGLMMDGRRRSIRSWPPCSTCASTSPQSPSPYCSTAAGPPSIAPC